MTPEKVTDLKSVSGIMGLAAPLSMKTNPIRAATPSRLAASTGASAPCFGATVKAQVVAAKPRVTAMAPPQSTGPERAPLLSRALASTSQTATAATGRLMKNTARQEMT